MNFEDLPEGSEPVFAVCANCGHQVVTQFPLTKCEFCLGGATWIEYFTDGEDADNYSQSVIDGGLIA